MDLRAQEKGLEFVPVETHAAVTHEELRSQVFSGQVVKTRLSFGRKGFNEALFSSFFLHEFEFLFCSDRSQCGVLDVDVFVQG